MTVSLPDMREPARKAVGEAIAAGADGLADDGAFWRQVASVLGNDISEEDEVVAECILRLSNCRTFADAIAFRTLGEAARKRLAK